MKLEALPWLILFLPLLAAGIIALFTLRNKTVSATLSIGAIVAGFVFTLTVIKFGGWEARELSLNWLSIGNLSVDFGLKLDRLSLMMLLIVTGVGSAIHIYSYGYMHDDPGFSRFFACLSLFTFSMLGIVLSNNFLQLFIFWELLDTPTSSQKMNIWRKLFESTMPSIENVNRLRHAKKRGKPGSCCM